MPSFFDSKLAVHSCWFGTVHLTIWSSLRSVCIAYAYRVEITDANIGNEAVKWNPSIFDKISTLYSRKNQTVASVQCYYHNSALINAESTCTSYDYANYLAYCTASFWSCQSSNIRDAITDSSCLTLCFISYLCMLLASMLFPLRNIAIFTS